MKMISIILLLLVNSDTFQTGTYEYKRKGRIYSLQIKDEGNFSYAIPRIFGTRHESGRWRTEADLLVLMDSVGTEHSKESITGHKSPNQDHIIVQVMNENDEPLANIKVSLNEDDLFRETNENGVARFEFSELKKHRFSERHSKKLI